jgi:hypothetical protein
MAAERFCQVGVQISLAGEVVFAGFEEARRDPRKAGEGGGERRSERLRTTVPDSGGVFVYI